VRRIIFSFQSVVFVPSIDDNDNKIYNNDGSFWSFTKNIIFGTLPYLTCGFLVVFLTKFTPTLRQDSFRHKIIFNWIPKWGCIRGSSSKGERGDSSCYRRIPL
jgi:hypothetical protein